jgi:hypothetical protein
MVARGRRLRVGDAVFIACALLLVIAVVNRVESHAQTRAMKSADRAAFIHYERVLRGRFGAVVVTHRRAADLACARRLRPAGPRLCLVIRGGHVASVVQERPVLQ